MGNPRLFSVLFLCGLCFQIGCFDFGGGLTGDGDDAAATNGQGGDSQAGGNQGTAGNNQQAANQQAANQQANGGGGSDVYGDQGGEEVLAADPSIPFAPLRARKDDTFYKLSNPKRGRDRFGRPTLEVDYQMLRQGKHKGMTLVIHTADGDRDSVHLIGAFDERGTIQIEYRFGPFANVPENAELYLTRGDGRYGPKSPTFKVSTSTVMGKMPKTTLARNWTQEEIDRLTQPPPNHTYANAHPGVGRDTPFVGDTKGGIGQRFVDHEGHLYGLEYRVSKWDGEDCLGQVVAVFDRDQPAILPARLMAKEGYAIGGVNVHSVRFVNAVQAVFHKVKPDGTLDPADSYTSDWVGFPQAGKTPTTLGGDGGKIIGIHCRQGAILNGLALVLANQ